MTKDKIYEKDLFPPLKRYFEKQGYKVNAEVKDCDIVITKDDYIGVIEMKLALNITLVHQALQRLAITENVYMAVKKPKKNYFKERVKMIRLAKRLNIGLIVVHPKQKFDDTSVEILYQPQDTKSKTTKNTEKILKEIKGRRLDTNVAGVTQTKVLTAYRDISIRIACICEAYTVVNNAFLTDYFGIEKGYFVVYNNFYGYFTMLGKGDYGISDKGLQALNSKEFEKLVALYREEIRKKQKKDMED
ncbi:MAG: DUF2161 family putative PD-(D/E)XK-type phosphodiesterase [Lachnospirales bacterium]